MDTTARLLGGAWAALTGSPSPPVVAAAAADTRGLLPCALPALPAVLAAVQASTLAAATLDAARTGGSVAAASVDPDHVAVAATSERHARQVGVAPTEAFAALSRFWPTADGWIRLHANYPWHQQRALAVLGCAPDAVGAAVLRWPGDDLAEALTAAGALGVVVRSPEQWVAHPQGRAAASQALLTTVDGDDRVARVPPPGRLAEGLRVVDLTRVIAGPVATRTLAAWGADVLRLDPPALPELPAQARDTLPGKRSADLDLTTDRGRARLGELLGEADVLVHGYRPGALAHHGLGPEDLALTHPHLSVVGVAAWAPGGPWAQRRGFDSLVQCATGIAHELGTDGRPGALPAQALDHATGHLAAAAALLALAGAARGEPPRHVGLSLDRTARWLVGAGPVPVDPERRVDPAPFLVTLPGAARPVTVVRPPGAVGDRAAGWQSTTELGADAPTFGRR